MSVFKPESFKHYIFVLVLLTLAILLASHMVDCKAQTVDAASAEFFKCLGFVVVYGVCSVLAFITKFNYTKSLFHRDFKFGGVFVGIAAFLSGLNVLYFASMVVRAFLA